MTSNIVTLPGRAPPVREVPAFKPRINGETTDVTRSDRTLGHHTHIIHGAHSIAESESPTAALDVLKDTQDLIVAHYNLFPTDEKQSAKMAFYKAFRRYTDACNGNTLEALEMAGDFKVAIDKERAVK